MSYYGYRSYSPYWSRIGSYLTRCEACGGTTSKKFSRANKGLCKKCASVDQAIVAGAVPATV